MSYSKKKLENTEKINPFLPDNVRVHHLSFPTKIFLAAANSDQLVMGLINWPQSSLTANKQLPLIAQYLRHSALLMALIINGLLSRYVEDGVLKFLYVTLWKN